MDREARENHLKKYILQYKASLLASQLCVVFSTLVKIICMLNYVCTYSPAITMYAGLLLVTPSFVLDTQMYSVLFTGLLINMFVPVRLCPGSDSLVSLASV